MKTVGAFLFPGFELLDLFGPLQFFGMLKDDYELKLLAESMDPVSSNQGPAVAPTGSFVDEIDIDILLVPGGKGTRREVDNSMLLSALTRFSTGAELTLGVCTGSVLLAKAGLLDGRRATTNKMAFEWVKSQGPEVSWVTKARWVEDGPFFTSSGVSAGMDMVLAVIAKLQGIEWAETVARWAEYRWHSDSQNDPFAELYGLS